MSDAVAAIDLGTNTFHLLIARGNGSAYQELTRRVDPVKLGEGGINKGTIAGPAFNRGLEMLREYAAICKRNEVKQIRAIGTSALRNASNCHAFSDIVMQETGIRITVINGDDEARFIYKGVRLSGCLSGEKSLIIDIGGGSVEFILCDEKKIWWKQSFEIGAARLMTKFHQTDPVPIAALRALHLYLDEQLLPLIKALQGCQVSHLVGSSGAFESFAEMIAPNFDIEKEITYDFEKEELLKTLSWLETSSHAQRLQTGRIIPVRIDMIVAAAALSHYIIQKIGIDNISMTSYSLKEGVMEELIANS